MILKLSDEKYPVVDKQWKYKSMHLDGGLRYKKTKESSNPIPNFTFQIMK